MKTLSLAADHDLHGIRHQWTLAFVVGGLTVGGLTGHTLERLLDTNS